MKLLTSLESCKYSSCTNNWESPGSALSQRNRRWRHQPNSAVMQAQFNNLTSVLASRFPLVWVLIRLFIF